VTTRSMPDPGLGHHSLHSDMNSVAESVTDSRLSRLRWTWTVEVLQGESWLVASAAVVERVSAGSWGGRVVEDGGGEDW
jgi:hypothetical protein